MSVRPEAADLASARRRAGRRRKLVTGAFSAAAHAGLLFAFLSAQPPPRPAPQPQPIEVALMAPPAPPAPTPAPPSPEPTPPAKTPPPPKLPVRHTPPRPDVKPLPAGDSRDDGPGVELSDAQLASASAAGAGGGGRPCDMARRLQTALRKDPRVQAAVAEARAQGTGRALFLWNGDWIRSRGQEGEGLAAVREAIMWEVAFAPEACRAEPVHGLVLFSMNDAPGSAGVVVGSGAWRWTDLLKRRGGG